jgi:hypothetical protein
MTVVLHILTSSAEPLARQIIDAQRRDAQNELQVVELDKREPDYKALLEKIFAADSITVW